MIAGGPAIKMIAGLFHVVAIWMIAGVRLCSLEKLLGVRACVGVADACMHAPNTRRIVEPRTSDREQ